MFIITKLRLHSFTPCCVILKLVLITYTANAQYTGLVSERYHSLQQNSVTTLETYGDTLWAGPGLNKWVEFEDEWFVPTSADSVFYGRGRVYSLSLSRDTVVAGIGYTSTQGDQSIQTAMGYYRSTDGGNNWKFSPFPLENSISNSCNPESEQYQPECDITFTYGNQQYKRLPVTVPQQSPPFEVDFSGNTILSVNWASGLIRSLNGGKNWERIILPPSSETILHPENEYHWNSRAKDGTSINRYDPRFDNNLLGFGLLIDSSNRVWVGTASGINISNNALSAPADQISWERRPFTGDPDGLIGGWIIKIRENPETGTIWLTNWPSDPDNRDQFGLVSTTDGGNSFSHHLTGIQVNDIAFHNGIIYAAANEGLFKSVDQGENWSHIQQIFSPNTFIKKGTRYLSAAATDQKVWIGTNDGLASSNNGETWEITRVDFPLRGGNVYQPDAPDTETFAYPNPFSPSRHQLIRIKYEVTEQNRVRIRIFDFGMNLIRNLEDQVLSPGTHETSWDGQNNRGLKVDNGPVIYVIEVGNRKLSGKILILD
jgi:hypothetical protein